MVGISPLELPGAGFIDEYGWNGGGEGGGCVYVYSAACPQRVNKEGFVTHIVPLEIVVTGDTLAFASIFPRE